MVRILVLYHVRPGRRIWIGCFVDPSSKAGQPVCGELLIFDTNQQFATHRLIIGPLAFPLLLPRRLAAHGAHGNRLPTAVPLRSPSYEARASPGPRSRAIQDVTFRVDQVLRSRRSFHAKFRGESRRASDGKQFYNSWLYSK